MINILYSSLHCVIFTARRYASAVYVVVVRLSVCLYVTLYQNGQTYDVVK